MTEFGTKNALFGYFWVRNLKKLLSYLKSAPSNFSNCKIVGKKNALLEFLGLSMKGILSYLKSTLSNLSN